MLDAEQKRLIREAAILPPLIILGIRLFGVGNTQGWLRRWAVREPRAGRPAEANATIAMARRAQRLVGQAAGIGGTCLPRSLTLWAMLLRRGLQTELRVGFRRLEGKMEGHAWVEFEGTPLNERADVVETYAALKEPVSYDLGRSGV